MGALQPAKPVLVGSATDDRLRSSDHDGRRLGEVVRVAVRACRANFALSRNSADYFLSGNVGQSRGERKLL